MHTARHEVPTAKEGKRMVFKTKISSSKSCLVFQKNAYTYALRIPRERLSLGTQCALRTPEERLPSGVPKEEFGRMIFENKSSMEHHTKVQSTPSAADRGGEAWRRNAGRFVFKHHPAKFFLRDL